MCTLFLYLVGLAISSNVVTTVSMVADPPATILAWLTGMTFLDFYWFQGKPGLGTLSIVGVAVALLTLLVQFRHLNNLVDIREERVRVTYGPLLIFVLCVLALALIPMSHPGIVGFLVGLTSLFVARKVAGAPRAMTQEFDWDTIWFLMGIFIVIGAVESVGLLRDFADSLSGTGLRNATIFSWMTWI